MSVSKEVIANVNNTYADYVKCENCYHNKGVIVGNVIDCSFWKNNDFSIGKNDFCSFWADKKGGAERTKVAELDKMPMISKKHKGGAK